MIVIYFINEEEKTYFFSRDSKQALEKSAWGYEGATITLPMDALENKVLLNKDDVRAYYFKNYKEIDNPDSFYQVKE